MDRFLLAHPVHQDFENWNFYHEGEDQDQNQRRPRKTMLIRKVNVFCGEILRSRRMTFSGVVLCATCIRRNSILHNLMMRD